MMTDPLADMLTRIRNGQQARKTSVASPASKLRGSVLDVLKREGYIRGYAAAESDTGKPAFSIELKYHEGRPVIAELRRISKPGRRVYSGIKGPAPVFRRTRDFHSLNAARRALRQ